MIDTLIAIAWFFGKVFLGINILLGTATVLTLTERRISAWIQGRKGPNRVGPQGMLQPIADIVKFMTKEEIVPETADGILYLLGPLLVFVPPMLGFGVIPFGNAIGEHQLQIAHIDIGVLFLMSVLSVGVYGITLGGWASNNKYSLLGALRASAQLISYELSLGLSVLLVVMMSGTLDLQKIVWQQVDAGVFGWNIFGGGSWWALPSALLGFGMMFVCAFAENNRLPFDLSECDAELVGGYHTEYSGMKFAMYMLAEYVAMILMSSLMVTLFFGGWDIPFLHLEEQPTIFGAILSMGCFMAKISVFLVTYQWVRWTLPRFKYQQLMDLGWKAFLPISLGNIAVLATLGVLMG
jgi:NADH-quinone oxidoreductase subunit H